MTAQVNSIVSGGNAPTILGPFTATELAAYPTAGLVANVSRAYVYSPAVSKGDYLWNGTAWELTGAATDFGSAASVASIGSASMALGVSPTTEKSAPAFVRSIGASNAVAAAMEAFSAAMPKGGRTIAPTVVEQGVIRLAPGVFTLEKPLNIDISLATDSRIGLTIEGTGNCQTLFYVPPTANPALFRDVFGDGIWRAIRMRGVSAGAVLQEVRLRNFRIVSYATQGADGVTKLEEPCRWLDLTHSYKAILDDITVYSRNLAAGRLDQYAFAFSNNYYSQYRHLVAETFPDASNKGYAANGTQKDRKPGVGFRLNDNNAATFEDCHALGVNLGWHICGEDGISISGGACENHNKSFLFDGDSNGNRVLHHRSEFNQISSVSPIEAGDETYFAKFTENTSNNVVQLHSRAPVPLNLKIDRSATQSNRVVSPDRVNTRPAINLLSSATYANTSGVTSTSSADAPTGINPAIAAAVEVTYTGSYNTARQVSAAIPVNPDWGSLTYRVYHKRVSGLGMAIPHVVSIDNQGNRPIYGSQAHSDGNLLWSNLIAVNNVRLAASGHSWAAGKLTLQSLIPHGLQPGMRVQSGLAGWGSLAPSTNLYVDSLVSDVVVVLAAAAGGSIPDPGAFTAPSAIQIPPDMIYSMHAANITTNWQRFVTVFPLRQKCTALSLNGSNIPVLTGINLVSAITGVKLRMSGFADPRLNVDYTVLAGDVSGNTLTLTGLGAMPGLVTTNQSSSLLGEVFYGWIGLREVWPEWRCLTSNTGQPFVHRFAGEALYVGSQEAIDA